MWSVEKSAPTSQKNSIIDSQDSKIEFSILISRKRGDSLCASNTVRHLRG
jgi:hypothetical protein